MCVSFKQAVILFYLTYIVLYTNESCWRCFENSFPCSISCFEQQFHFDVCSFSWLFFLMLDSSSCAEAMMFLSILQLMEIWVVWRVFNIIIINTVRMYVLVYAFKYLVGSQVMDIHNFPRKCQIGFWGGWINFYCHHYFMEISTILHSCQNVFTVVCFLPIQGV